jgi:hypothetical protein
MRSWWVLLWSIFVLSSMPSSASALGWAVETPPSPAGATAANLEGISCSNSPSSNCKAVGKYSISGTQNALALSWNGTSWAVQGTPELSWDELFGTSCITSSFCVGVGTRESGATTLAEHWNGSSWTTATTPNPGTTGRQFYGVSCTAATACTAVGGRGGTTIQRENLAARWNGTSWSAQTTPNPGDYQNDLFSVSCTSSTHCTAVGRQRMSNSVNWSVAMGWNGSTWATLTTPNPIGASWSELRGVSCTSSTSCIAVGYSQQGGLEYPYAVHWNGTSWTLKSVPLPENAYYGYLYGVSCATASACIAVGSYTPKGPPYPSLTYAAKWNGTSWTVETPPNPGASSNRLKAVSCLAANACKAAGDYYNSSGVRVPLIANFTG